MTYLACRAQPISLGRGRDKYEDPSTPLGYVDRIVEANQQAAVAVTPGHAHLVRNIDTNGRTLYLSVCVDTPFNVTDVATDYKVWSSTSILSSVIQ